MLFIFFFCLLIILITEQPSVCATLCNVVIKAISPIWPKMSYDFLNSKVGFIWYARLWSDFKREHRQAHLIAHQVCFVKWSLTLFHTFCSLLWLIHLITFSLACRRTDFPTDKYSYVELFVFYLSYLVEINLITTLFIWFEETISPIAAI